MHGGGMSPSEWLEIRLPIIVTSALIWVGAMLATAGYWVIGLNWMKQEPASTMAKVTILGMPAWLTLLALVVSLVTVSE